MTQLGRLPPDGGYDYDLLLQEIRGRVYWSKGGPKGDVPTPDERLMLQRTLYRDLLVTIRGMEGPVAFLAEEALKAGDTLDE